MEVNLGWPSQDELLSPWRYCPTCNDLTNPCQVNSSILWCVWEIMCGLIIPIIPITSQSHLIHSHLPTRLWGIRGTWAQGGVSWSWLGADIPDYIMHGLCTLDVSSCRANCHIIPWCYPPSPVCKAWYTSLCALNCSNSFRYASYAFPHSMLLIFADVNKAVMLFELHWKGNVVEILILCEYCHWERIYDKIAQGLSHSLIGDSWVLQGERCPRDDCVHGNLVMRLTCDTSQQYLLSQQ